MVSIRKNSLKYYLKYLIKKKNALYYVEICIQVYCNSGKIVFLYVQLTVKILQITTDL